jgi:hypothetical protein
MLKEDEDGCWIDIGDEDGEGASGDEVIGGLYAAEFVKRNFEWEGVVGN